MVQLWNVEESGRFLCHASHECAMHAHGHLCTTRQPDLPLTVAHKIAKERYKVVHILYIDALTSVSSCDRVFSTWPDGAWQAKGTAPEKHMHVTSHNVIELTSTCPEQNTPPTCCMEQSGRP